MLNNETLDMCPDEHRYDHLLKISLVIWRFCGPSAILLGLPGHVFHIATLTHQLYRKDPQSLYLAAVSVCDLIFLLGLSHCVLC